MPDREEIEKLLTELRIDREEAEAEAGHAAQRLAHVVSGITPPAGTDPEQVRAASETFCDAVARLKMLERFARDLRGLLT